MGGKLWIFWNHEVDLSVFSMEDQFITSKIIYNLKEFLVTFVYAKCYYMERRRFWASLANSRYSHMPRIMAGGFNIICVDQDRRGVVRN